MQVSRAIKAVANPISDQNLGDSFNDKVSFSKYRPSLPSQQNARIQYDIDEFMKNANQYLTRNDKYAKHSAQNQRSSRYSKNQNKDIQCIMGASGQSFKFKHILNMPFTPPSNHLTPITRRQFSVHMNNNNNNNQDGQNGKQTTQDTVSTDQQPIPQQYYNRVFSEENHRRERSNRNSELYKMLQQNKDQLKQVEKNFERPASKRKVSLIKNVSKNSRNHEQGKIRTSVNTQNSDLFSSNYSVLPPSMNKAPKKDNDIMSKINQEML